MKEELKEMDNTEEHNLKNETQGKTLKITVIMED